MRNDGSNTAPKIQALTEKILQRDWAGVRTLFASDHKGEIAPLLQKSSIGDPSNSDAETVLHLCCRMHPPLYIVMVLVSAFPKAPSIADRMGQYPIHIAAKCGASDAVVSFLVDKNADAAAVQDKMGKTPLHLACEHFMFAYEPDDEEGYVPPVEYALMTVITKLGNSAPSSLNLEDMNDMSALEYAIQSKCPLTLVKMLQKMSEKDWKLRRRNNENHIEVENGLQRQCLAHKQRLEADVHVSTHAEPNHLINKVGKALTKPFLSRRRKRISSQALSA